MGWLPVIIRDAPIQVFGYWVLPLINFHQYLTIQSTDTSKHLLETVAWTDQKTTLTCAVRELETGFVTNQEVGEGMSCFLDRFPGNQETWQWLLTCILAFWFVKKSVQRSTTGQIFAISMLLGRLEIFFSVWLTVVVSEDLGEHWPKSSVSIPIPVLVNYYLPWICLILIISLLGWGKVLFSTSFHLQPQNLTS